MAVHAEAVLQDKERFRCFFTGDFITLMRQVAIE